MRKSILGTTAMIVVLAVAFGDGSWIEDIGSQATVKRVQNTVRLEETVPEQKVIEEEAVPLSGTPAGAAGVEPLAAPESRENEESGKEESAANAQGKDIQEKDAQEKEESAVNVQEKADENAGKEKMTGYDRDAAHALVDEVNKLRTQGSLVLSEELSQVAEQRACSCVEKLDHDGMETMGECIAKGQNSQTEAVNAWKNSEYHKTLMCDAQYTKAGAACLRYEDENGCQQIIWVMVLD